MFSSWSFQDARSQGLCSSAPRCSDFFESAYMGYIKHTLTAVTKYRHSPCFLLELPSVHQGSTCPSCVQALTGLHKNFLPDSCITAYTIHVYNSSRQSSHISVMVKHRNVTFYLQTYPTKTLSCLGRPVVLSCRFVSRHLHGWSVFWPYFAQLWSLSTATDVRSLGCIWKCSFFYANAYKGVIFLQRYYPSYLKYRLYQRNHMEQMNDICVS